MKYVFIFCFLIFTINITSAQTEPHIIFPNAISMSNDIPIDTSILQVTYILNADTLEKNKMEYCEDIQILEIGENVAKYYSYFIYESDSLVTEWRKKNPKATVIYRSMLHSNKFMRPYWSVCFKDYESNSFTEYFRAPQSIKNYQYSEPFVNFNWAIHEDTLTICGYMCQKATCDFRGRTYTAWFSTEIPVNEGPWKFGGLPGLILKIYDKDKKFVFECTGISNKRKPITKHNYENYGKTSRKALLKLRNNIYDNYYTTAGFAPHPGLPAKRYKKALYHLFMIELE